MRRRAWIGIAPLAACALAGCKVTVVEHDVREPAPVVKRTPVWTAPRDNRRYAHWPQAERSSAPQVTNHLADGDRLFDEGDFHGAIREYGEAIRIDPKQAYAWCNRGSAKRRVQDYEGAVSDLTVAIQLQPHYALAYNNRGYASMMLDQINAALEDFTTAIEIGDKASRSFRVSMAHRNRAKAWRCLGQEERAREDDARADALTK